jgi:hypothetical protein
MSCWVVPGVAAELWGVALEQVLESIRLNQIPSKREYHFTLVDVAPNSPKAEPLQAAHAPRKPTYMPITSSKDPNPEPLAQNDNPSTPEEESSESDLDDAPLNWKQSRLNVVRRPPPHT